MAKKRFLTPAIVLTFMVSLFSAPKSAQAREMSATKTCTKGNTFEFSVDWERNKVDFDFDIEQGDPFERWSIRITRDGEGLVRSRLTSDEDGDLSREYVRRGQLVAGERWEFVGKSATGNSCRASLRF